MSPLLIIARHELLHAVRRRSFLLIAFGLPLIAGAIAIVLSLAAGSPEDAAAQFAIPEGPTGPQGYVDHAGVIATIPESLEGAFVPFAGEAEARRAVAERRIDGYFVVPADFIETGDLHYYDRQFNPLGAEGRTLAFRYAITLNLAGDPELASLLWEPAQLQSISLEAREPADTGGMASFWLPYAILMILFISLSMATGWLLQSVTNEKDTRMLEIMLSSVHPRDMLMGKTIGLGLAGLAQVAIWLVTASLLLRLSGRALSVPEGLDIGAGTVIWGIVFFLLGYAIYASLIAGLGALAPSLREASSATFLVYVPLIVPLWFINAIISQPNSLLSVVLSLVPFTAPVAMIGRLVRVSPPAWQMALAVVLMLATAYLTVHLAARLFRAQTLLSGQPLSLARLGEALRSP